jgi:hypothetical protein
MDGRAFVTYNYPRMERSGGGIENATTVRVLHCKWEMQVNSGSPKSSCGACGVTYLVRVAPSKGEDGCLQILARFNPSSSFTQQIADTGLTGERV